MNLDSRDNKGWKGIGAVEIAIGGAVLLGIGALGYWTATKISCVNERLDKLENKVKELEKALHDYKKAQALTNKDLAKATREHSRIINELDITNTISKIQNTMTEIEDRLDNLGEDEEDQEKPKKKKKSLNKSKTKPKKPVKPIVKPRKTEDTEEEADDNEDDEENIYDLL
jgi:septal ring factor EnvC (AmiA/AmiB activator)